MTTIFPFPLFPPSLASSVITTVWVGVFVVAFFNLKFGWVLSGLVIPGYIVPILFASPWSAGVVLIEGVLTYTIVWVLSEKLAQIGMWSGLFGRDRFFAILLLSIAVRLAMDEWLLPYAGEWLNNYYNLKFDYRTNLHSFGLVIVALIANTLWKPGFRKGIWQLLTVIGTTYFLVRYVLIPCTNFSPSNLAILYEDVASSMLASPKTYIILIVTAFLASRANLLYGWDFNGILVPSLLALEWYQPTKIAATLCESLVILCLASSILRLRFFELTTVEGARKILFFFNVSFLYKLLIGFAFMSLAPNTKVSDAYGFGYLLPTMIALKIHETGFYLQVPVAILRTSLASVIAATLLGVALTLLPLPAANSEPGSTRKVVGALEQSASIEDAFRRERVRMYASLASNDHRVTTFEQRQAFTRALAEVRDFCTSQSGHAFEQASQALASLDYQLDLIGDRYLVLHEKTGDQGSGWFVIDMGSPSTVIVEVARPFEFAGAAEAGFALFHRLGARALAIGGTQVSATIRARVPDSLFDRLRREFSASGVLQIGEQSPQSILRVSENIPWGVDLQLLQTLIGEYSVEWSRTDGPALAELRLNADATRRLLRGGIATDSVRIEEGSSPVGNVLRTRLSVDSTAFAQSGSDAYLVPDVATLLYADRELVSPLVRLLEAGSTLTPEQLDELAILAWQAKSIGYQIFLYKQLPRGTLSVVLAQEDTSKRRYWGLYVFNPGSSRPIAIQVPRPVADVHTAEVGFSLFDATSPSALLIAGAHPDANRDGSANVLDVSNKVNFFNLVSQVLLREWRERPGAVVQLRAFAPEEGFPMPRGDVFVASTSSGVNPAAQSQLLGVVRDALAQQHLSLVPVSSAPELADYGIGPLTTPAYLSQAENKDFIVLWLSPVLRGTFKSPEEEIEQVKQMAALQIPSTSQDLAASAAIPDYFDFEENVPPSFISMVQNYVRTRDIVALKEVQSRSYEIERILDTTSNQAFLTFRVRGRGVALLVNLNPIEEDSRIVLRRGDDRLLTMTRFVATRCATLQPTQ